MRDCCILIAILEKYFLKRKAQENDKTVTIYKKCYSTVLQKQTFLLKLGTR